MARIPSGPQNLCFRVQHRERGHLVRLIVEAEATDEILLVVEMTFEESTALIAQLLDPGDL